MRQKKIICQRMGSSAVCADNLLSAAFAPTEEPKSEPLPAVFVMQSINEYQRFGLKRCRLAGILRIKIYREHKIGCSRLVLHSESCSISQEC